MTAVVNESPRTALESGTVVAGKYRIDRTVGAGGMGVVLAATHIQLEQTVAVKVLQAEALRAPGAMDRFLREARTVARMRSDHIARVYDVGTLDTGEPYAVMEFLDGQDLSKLLEQRGQLNVGETVSLLLQACEALAEAHELGIVHRDLKPENMFITTSVDRRPFVKIIDFGLAKSLLPATDKPPVEMLTRSFTMMGTPLYMSPEQLRSTRDVDLRTDIWSLGIVAYEMLAGRAPFDASSLPDLCASIVRDEVPPIQRPDVPPELADAILRCLAKDPGDRFSKIAKFAAVIADFAEAEDRSIIDRILRVQPLTSPPPRRLQSNPELPAVAAALSVQESASPSISESELRVRPSRTRRLVTIGVVGLVVGLGIVSLSLAARKPTEPSGIVASAVPAPTATGPTATETATAAPSGSAPSPAPFASAPPAPVVTSIATGSPARPVRAAPATAPPPRATAKAQPKDPLETR